MGSTPSVKNLEIVPNESGLTHSKQLSSLTKADHCSTHLSIGSTRNAPELLNISPMFGKCTEEVYDIYEEDNGSNKEENKPKKTVP
jgi:hypothetical protein